MLRTLLLTLLLLTATPAFAAMPALGNGYGAIDAKRNIEPLDLARRFCAARRSGDMSAVARFFAPKLTRLVAARAGTRIPWQTYDRRPTSCSLEVVNGFDDTIGVLVRITYVADGLRWSDTLNLERTPDSWRINNVFYETGGNLRFRLVQSP